MATDVTKLIKEATEAVKHVPENLQEIAFSKAFDTLLAKQSGDNPAAASETRSRNRGSKNSSSQRPKSTDSQSLDQLDRTAHPEITPEGKALNNALYVLLAARNDLGIDGLSASAIAHLLLEKFRCKTSRQSISQSLNDAGRYVNRHKEGNAVIFRIMGAGENYLEKLQNGDEEKPKPRKKRRAATQVKKKKVSKKKGSNTKAAKKPSTQGPKAALLQLCDDGFFSKPRLIGDIIGHLKDTVGRTYKNTDMSPTLLRLLREKILVRKKNSDNQYEYSNA